MTSEEAFDIIVKAMNKDKRYYIIHQNFDSKNFGNFTVRFKYIGRNKTLTCDRSQIIIDYSINGKNLSHLAVECLDYISEKELLEALGLS